MEHFPLRKLFTGIMIVWMCTGLTSLALGGQIRLAWDANSEPDLAGYRIYYGTASRSYGTPVNVGKTTTHTLTGLTTGQRYYIAMTAYDSATPSNESACSAEVSGVATDPTSSVTITVTTNPTGRQVVVDGTSYPSPSNFTWLVGSSHSLSVSSPQSGTSGTRYVYSSWNDGGGRTHNITVPSFATTYIANFTVQHTLTTTTDPSGGGTVTPSGENWYNRGNTVSVSAAPSRGYSFSAWSGSLTGTTNPAQVTVDGVKNLTARFTQNHYTLAVSPSPSIAGSVTKSPNKTTYLYGEQVTLTAAPNSGYAFNNWSGSVTSTVNPVTITMNGSKNVTANFSPVKETISTPTAPSGPTTGTIGARYSYVTGGSSSNLGHPIQYRFDWGDGVLSAWSSSTGASKTWAAPGSYTVKAQARCGTCLTILSNWSSGRTVRMESEAGFLSVTPTNGWDASGPMGGPFSPSSQNYTLQNTGKSLINWAASKNQPWLSLSTRSGSLAPGASATVTVSLNENAKQLGLGEYSDAVTINNLTNGRGNSTHPVHLTVKGVSVAHRIATNPSGLEVIVDGVTYRTPKRFNWETGSTHTLSAPTVQGGTKKPYYFSSWSDGGSREHEVIAPSTSTTYTAHFTPQVNPTATVNSAYAGAVLPLVGKLESPLDGKRVAGIKPIYGWAADREGIDRVELFVDGNFICSIPYGGIRQDIKEAYPAYPGAVESGFAMIWNYSVLTPGEHTIQVRVTNTRGESVDLTAGIEVLRFHGDVVTAITPDQVPSQSITVTADGVSRTYDVSIEWTEEAQDFGITDILPRK